jgi:delta 1-pyrroline-5-carboxylate dehydrogenase
MIVKLKLWIVKLYKKHSANKKSVVQSIPIVTPSTQPKGFNLLLDHLVSAKEADFLPDVSSGVPNAVPLKNASPAQLLDAQSKTADWLKTITNEDEEMLDRAQEERAADTFSALIAQNPDIKNKLLNLETPEEVKQVVGMVTAYQWKFVEQAQELRSMAVTKIAKETEHPDARIRLKALELLGKVTEVALFTDRVEVKKTELSDEELEAQIKKKLEKYMGVVDVVEVEEADVEDVGIVKEIKPKE